MSSPQNPYGGYPPMPYQPARPPPARHTTRNVIIISCIAGFFLLTLILGLTGHLDPPPAGHPAAAAVPAATHSAAESVTPQPSRHRPSPAVLAARRIAKWNAGPGGHYLHAVAAQFVSVERATSSGDLAATDRACTGLGWL